MLGRVTTIVAALLLPALACAAPVKVDVHAQKMPDALAALTEQLKLQIVYDGKLVAGMSAPAVSGVFEPEAALTRLLAGTDLTFRFINPTTVTIEKAPRRDSTRTLGPVRVEGASGSGAGLLAGANGSTDPTSTEGTGSFTPSKVRVGAVRAVDVLDVPQSVSVLTERQMTEQNITSMEDAMRRAPGIVFSPGYSTGGTSGAIYSRGAAITSFQLDGGASLDPYKGGLFGTLDLARFEHIEILRGPDALKVASGSYTGTINLVSKKPLDHDQVIVELTGARWNDYRAMLDASGPLNVLGLKGRLVGSFENRRFFYDGAKSSGESIYGVLEANPLNDLAVRVGISHTRNDNNAWWGGLPRFNTGESLGLPRNTGLSPPWTYLRSQRTEQFVSLDFAAETPWLASMSWQGSVRYSHNVTEADTRYAEFTGSVNPVTFEGVQLRRARRSEGQKGDALSVTMGGQGEAWGHKLDLSLGYNLSSDDGTGQKTYAGVDVVAIPDFFAFDPGSVAPNGASPEYVTYEAKVREVRATGLLAKLVVGVTDRLDVLAGGNRLSQKNTEESETHSAPPWLNVPPSYISLHELQTQGDFRPYYGLIYRLADSASVYLNYADVRNAGQIRRDVHGVPLPPTHGDQYELGARHVGFDGRLQSSVAFYRASSRGGYARDRSVPSIQDPVDNSLCCYTYNENSKQLSEGVDVEVTGEAGGGMSLTASYNFSRLRKDNPLSDSDGQTFNERFPRHLVKVWASYRPPMMSRWNFGLGITGSSTYYASGTAAERIDPATGRPVGALIPFEFTQKGYALVDGAATYALSKTLNLSLNVDNLLDETYYERIGTVTGGNFYGTPRTYTLRLRGIW
ncbi:TonB-dependent siderophore receptor [Steroidobacter flavus]|uniref:TonB-dependent siderophore receptor n=1 Tax=Steroidobacter flavus TaxID=1842136 RepID=A0ABV8T2S1_9GAMM